jgi:hypothetical protein
MARGRVNEIGRRQGAFGRWAQPGLRSRQIALFRAFGPVVERGWIAIQPHCVLIVSGAAETSAEDQKIRARMSPSSYSRYIGAKTMNMVKGSGVGVSTAAKTAKTTIACRRYLAMALGLMMPILERR